MKWPIVIALIVVLLLGVRLLNEYRRGSGRAARGRDDGGSQR